MGLTTLEQNYTLRTTIAPEVLTTAHAPVLPKRTLIFALGNMGRVQAEKLVAGAPDVHVLDEYSPDQPLLLAQNVIATLQSLSRKDPQKNDQHTLLIPIEAGDEPALIEEPKAVEWPREFTPDLGCPTDPLMPFLDGAIEIDGFNDFPMYKGILRRYPIGATTDIEEFESFLGQPQPLRRREIDTFARSNLRRLGRFTLTEIFANDTIVFQASNSYGQMHFSVKGSAEQYLIREPFTTGPQVAKPVRHFWSPKANRLLINTSEPGTLHLYSL